MRNSFDGHDFGDEKQVNAKRSSLGSAAVQRFLTVKDMRGTNSGGKVFGLICKIGEWLYTTAAGSG